MWQKSGDIPINLIGWEHSTDTLKDGQELHDLYSTPDERDPTRDYTEGQVEFGGLSPEGLMNLTPVLQFYAEHRTIEKLFETPEPLQTVLNRMPEK